MKTSLNLLEGSVSKSLIAFGFPLFLNYLLQALYGSADTYIVSHYSDFGNITGVTLGSQITYLLTAFISGFATAVTILVARHSGARDKEKLFDSVSTVMLFFLLTAVGLTILMLICAEPLLSLLDVPLEAYKPTLAYLIICTLGTICVFLYNATSSVLQALGDSKHPLYFVLYASLINITLDLVLVGKYDMGAEGAAYATVFAQLISCVLSYREMKRIPEFADICFRKLYISKEQLPSLWRLGIPYAIQRVTVGLSFTAVSGIVNGYGLIAATASGIVSKINNFATLPFTAVQSAMVSMSSQNFGAGQKVRVRQVLKVGWTMNMTIGLVMFALTWLFSAQIVGFFNPDVTLIMTAIPFLRLYAFEYIIMPTNFSLHAVMSGAGHTAIPMFGGVLSAILLRVPLCLLFSGMIGFPGIALGSALATSGAFCNAVWFYTHGAGDPNYKFRLFSRGEKQ